MRRYLLWVFCLLSLAFIQPGFAQHVALPEGISSVRATWLWGLHSVPGDITKSGSPYWYSYPHNDVSRIDNPAWSDVAEGHIKLGAKAPALLVLHGCSGLVRGDMGYRRYFVSRGYAVFEPDSFARPGHTCDGSPFQDRVEELGQALREIRKLRWVEQEQIYLMGFSQGGGAVASWSKPGFAGHIILASACPYLKSQVPAAPKNVPVLSVVGEKDLGSNGASCQTKTHAPGSQSVVIKGAGHVIMNHPETGKAIAAFCRQ